MYSNIRTVIVLLVTQEVLYAFFDPQSDIIDIIFFQRVMLVDFFICL